MKKQELAKKRNTAAAAIPQTLSIIKVNRLPSLPAEVSMADIQEKRESVKSPKYEHSSSSSNQDDDVID